MQAQISKEEIINNLNAANSNGGVWGHENQYYKFAQKVNSRGLKVKVGVAKERGDNFFYKRE